MARMIDAAVSSAVLRALCEQQSPEGPEVITGFAMRSGWGGTLVVDLSVRSNRKERATVALWEARLKDAVAQALHPHRNIVDVIEQG